MSLRIGFGYDIHRLVAGRPLWLGAIEIPFEKGLLGHSDGDAISHALCDAQFGAVGLGDIGEQFPDTDPAWKGVSGKVLLEQTRQILAAKNAKLVQADLTVLAEAPRIAPHKESMIHSLQRATGCSDLSIKARSNEGLDSIGRGEAIAVYAMVMVEWDRT